MAGQVDRVDNHQLSISSLQGLHGATVKVDATAAWLEMLKHSKAN